MEIYVAKDNQKLGPYDLEEVHHRMKVGAISETDLAWREGLANWIPLSQVLGLSSEAVHSSSPAPPPVEEAILLRSSGLAKAAFTLGLVGIPFWITIVIVAAIGSASGFSEQSPMMIGTGLVMFGGMGGNIAGIVLGIIALTQTGFTKGIAVAGLTLNALELLGILSLMIIGMAMQ